MANKCNVICKNGQPCKSKGYCVAQSKTSQRGGDIQYRSDGSYTYTNPPLLTPPPNLWQPVSTNPQTRWEQYQRVRQMGDDREKDKLFNSSNVAKAVGNAVLDKVKDQFTTPHGLLEVASWGATGPLS